jgi:hypothetical protein
MRLDRSSQKRPGLLEGQHPAGAPLLPEDHGGIAISVSIQLKHIVMHFGERPVQWFAMTSQEAKELSILLAHMSDSLSEIENTPAPTQPYL